MSQPTRRVARVGFALILLATALGSASGAPVPRPAAPTATAEPAHPSPDTSAPAIATIPCISGTCQVRMQRPLAVPMKNAQPSPAPASGPGG
jgi:hypothetical protein